jgi:hypothetical protein
VSVRGFALAGVVGALSACVYYNALYNAERAFAEGERHRLAGRDSLAAARFRDVVRKAARGYRAEPEGPWADDAMLLVGRAHLRLGDHRAGRAALREAAERSEDPQVRLAALLHLASSFVQAGDLDAGIPLLNEAIQGLTDEATRAEGHLWRGRALMRLGQVDGGWWDLDQAGALHRSVRLAAALEKVQWGIVLDEPVRVHEGMNRIFSSAEGGDVPDTVTWLVRQAAGRWGATEGARLLAGVDSAAWSRSARARVRLARADLLAAAGDTLGARSEVEAVAGGRGPTAVPARLRLARERLARALDVPDVRAVASILLPSESDPDVSRLLSDIVTLTELTDRGLSDPLAWFLAAELARDRLGALDLARALFLTYADVAAEEPWTAKALLAALDVTRDEGERAWLRGRLEGRADSPYVLAARGEPAPGIEALEEELARRMQEIGSR